MTSGATVADRFHAALSPGESGDFDISAADRIGVPVVVADWIGDGPRYFGIGYGATVEQARTGAYGELLEGLLLNRRLRTLTPRRATYRQLRRTVGPDGVVDPRALVLPAGTVVHDEQPRDWLPAVRWCTGETVLVPAEFCVSSDADLVRQDPAERLITAITNGEGAGDTPERAVAHGLLELLQRDGNSTAFRAMDRGEVLSLDAVRDPVTLATLDRMRAAGIEVLPKLASTQFGMADVHVVGWDVVGGDVDAGTGVGPLALTACGEAVHPDREMALRKALLEYASSRLRKMFSHAPLEQVRPLAPHAYWERELAQPLPTQERRALEAMRAWLRCTPGQLLALLEPVVFSRRSTTPFSALPTVAPGSLDDQRLLLAELLTRLRGFDVLVVLAPGDGVAAAKVVVPGLEVETMSYGRIAHRGVAKLLERGSDLVGLGAPPRPGTAAVVLTEAGIEQLGGPAWLDVDGVARTVGPLYPLYREPARHAVARSET